MANNTKELYQDLLRDNPGISQKELARRLNRSFQTVRGNLHRFGLRLREFEYQKREITNSFVGDLFRDMEEAGINFRKSGLPLTSLHVYRAGKIFPTLSRLREIEAFAQSRVTTTGRIRARLEKIRASTNDLEMLGACAIMADIISEIEDE